MGGGSMNYLQCPWRSPETCRICKMEAKKVKDLDEDRIVAWYKKSKDLFGGLKSVIWIE